MIAPLPPEIAAGASLQDHEYGWKISSFPAALSTAERLGFACLGGQFQFRLDGSIFEMYWLDADAAAALPEEPWLDYVHRSCSEVAKTFDGLVEKMDIQKVIREWPALEAAVAAGLDPLNALVFVAYFVTRAEFLELSHGGMRCPDQNP